MNEIQSVTLQLYTTASGRIALDVVDYSPVDNRPPAALDRSTLFRTAFILQDIVAVEGFADLLPPKQPEMTVITNHKD